MLSDRLCSNSIQETLPLNEIQDEERRREFLKEYDRLAFRCGHNAMTATLGLYILEQQVEGNIIKKQPNISITVQKNTSEVIARLVEKGIADCYLTQEQSSPSIVLSNEKDVPVFIASFRPETIRVMTKEKGLPKLLTSEARNVSSVQQRATLIAPDDIRSVFSKIDAQYENP
jgi:hypothetical protein